MKIVLCLLFFGAQAYAGVSAQRPKNEDYEKTALKKWFLHQNSYNQDSSAVGLFDIQEQVTVSAYQAASAYEDLDHESVMAWESYEILEERFQELRDERFLVLDERKEEDQEEVFLRRISWLYPDDGCFARAALLINQTQKKEYKSPDRIFIFGNLYVQTFNHPQGEVNWWYHTAPVVRVEDQVYVLDPAIEPEHPLKVEDWIFKQVFDLEDAKVVYCSAETYGPYNSCYEVRSPNVEAIAHRDQKTYLRFEWGRQKSLGRDPEVVLGSEPPWLLGSY